ncbi:MAG: hypothetical protein J2P50_14205 [Hyphomicrobiaceae bacterium]|nr:hypothetical protein [Hyphomicrobiaceae bacterium]
MISFVRAQDVWWDPNRAKGSQKLLLEVEECPNWPVCLALLDAYLPSLKPHQSSGVGQPIANLLQRFGDPARQELLRRAAGADAGWRNLAGEILAYWGSWSPADVPAIRAGPAPRARALSKGWRAD